MGESDDFPDGVPMAPRPSPDLNANVITHGQESADWVAWARGEILALQAQVEQGERREAVYHDWAWEVLDNLSAEDAKKWSGNLGRALAEFDDT